MLWKPSSIASRRLSRRTDRILEPKKKAALLRKAASPKELSDMFIPLPAGPDKSAISAFVVAAFPSITHILGTAQPAWKAICASCFQLARDAITNASIAASWGRAATYLAIATALLATVGAL